MKRKVQCVRDGRHQGYKEDRLWHCSRVEVKLSITVAKSSNGLTSTCLKKGVGGKVQGWELPRPRIA